MPQRQRGAALLLIMLGIIVATATVLVSGFSPDALETRRQQATMQSLAEARNVVGGSAPIGVGSTNFATVSCAAGEVATGGGFLADSEDVHAYGSYPTGSPTPTGWRVDAKNTGTGGANISAYVVCATQ